MHPANSVHKLGLAILLLPGVFLSPAVGAAQIHARISGFGAPDVNAFDLHIAANDLELDYDDASGSETLRLRSIGIGLYETLGENSRIGVRLGRTVFDQNGRAATEGRDPTGYFAELVLSAMWPNDTPVRATLDAGWRYSSTEDTDDAGSVEVDWQTVELSPALWLALSERVVLRLGASAIAVDGTERLTGTSRETVDFEAAESVGGFASLEYHRRDGDVVSVRVRGGNPAGLYVAFEHRY